MDRITNKHLEGVVNRLNRVTGNPSNPWTKKNGKLTANIGNYHLYGAYGSTGLHRMYSEGGGVETVIHLTTKRDLYNKIIALLDGIEIGKEL